MNAALIFVAIVALASAVSGADPEASKKQDKRGILGLGYGGYAGHGLALGGYGYNGLSGHGYAAAPAYVDHAIAAPVAVSHGVHSISSAPVLSSPIHVGYGHGVGYTGHGVEYTGHGVGYSGLGVGHGLSYGHGW